ncbi:RJL family GTPase [Gonapodya prolifera JEL478]|uniref:RJL family GTPase n=1 Tax=Gonapodya prolifera (strain JEL478) TaxID=1344416 RepID=A0A139AZ38_GONPJ|nr:RJL family GTPase [Gonapodya prolifera JEL478]|eukprot:KXS21989.1 RJL family GTPase [Gonapodya prolifera JEL478]
MKAIQRERGRLPRAPPTSNPVKRVKVLSVGDPAVGKSCIIKRFCEGRFVQEYISTIGIDYGVKPVIVDGQELKVSFWDSAGDPAYFEIRSEFYKDTQGVLLVFDVSQRKSFESLDRWLQELKNLSGTDAVLIVVGNKIDSAQRTVPTTEIASYCAKIGKRFFETSASSGQGIQDLFDQMFSELSGKEKKS